MPTYYTDNIWLSDCVFSVDGVPTDPSPLTDVTVRVSSPGQPTQSYTYNAGGGAITHVGTGHFQIPITLDRSGIWIVEWKSVATNCVGKNYDTITVEPSLIP